MRQWVQTHTKAHALAYAVATEVGAMSEAESVHIAVSLQLRNKPELDTLTQALSAGRSSRVLSSQQFLERHAPTREQAVRVVRVVSVAGYVDHDAFNGRRASG